MSNRTFSLSRLHGVLLLVGSMAGCIPDDTRPAPGAVQFVAVPSPSDALPTPTLDGWTMTIDTSIVSMGEIELDGDNCAVYAESEYLRLLDMGPRAPQMQKLAITFGLGTCTFGFGVRSPYETSVVGAGVSPDMVNFMNTSGSDPFTSEKPVSLYVEGTATKDGVVKRYLWPFRRSLSYSSLGPLELGPNDSRTVEIHVAVSALFKLAQDVPGLYFDPIAAADTDSDGFITFDELSRVPYGEGFSSLGDFLHLNRLPDVFRVPSLSL